MKKKKIKKKINKEDQLKLKKKMNRRIFNFWSKIVTACKIWSQNVQSCLIMKMHFSFLENWILKLLFTYHQISYVWVLKGNFGGVDVISVS